MIEQILMADTTRLGSRSSRPVAVSFDRVVPMAAPPQDPISTDDLVAVADRAVEPVSAPTGAADPAAGDSTLADSTGAHLTGAHPGGVHPAGVGPGRREKPILVRVRPSPPVPRRAPLPVAAGVAALWAAVCGYGPLAVLAAIATVGSPGQIVGGLRLAALGWLLGQGVPVRTPEDQLTLIPLAVTVLAAWRLARAGVHASRVVGGHLIRSASRALVAAGVVAAVYGGVGATAAVLASSAAASAQPLRAGLTLGGFAFVTAGWGAVSHGRAGRARRRWFPVLVRDAVRTGLIATLLIVAAGAAAAGAVLATRGGFAADMLGSYHAGVLGQAGITILSAAYLPNLAVWGAAYLLGPGFSIGLDTIVSPGSVILGPVPAVPILGAVPVAPASGMLASALLGAPLAAAMVAGWLLGRGSGRSSRWGTVLLAAALAGPVAGIALQGLCAYASGAAGSGRLTLVGCTGWRVALFAAVVVTFGSAVAAVAARWLAARVGGRAG
jgi:hypothetical protein